MISRRFFLKSSLLLATPIISPNNVKASKSAHIVIIGAGWGGLSAAKTIRTLNKSIKLIKLVKVCI